MAITRLTRTEHKPTPRPSEIAAPEEPKAAPAPRKRRAAKKEPEPEPVAEQPTLFPVDTE